jgi:hypothetical protein
LLLVSAAFALGIHLDATVDADLRTIRGTLAVDADVALIDPLPLLPAPADDRDRLRTFPGRPDTGAMSWSPVPGFPGMVRFETRLPRRFGDVGVLPGRGLWGNGGWYPQPVDAAGDPVVADWVVTVRGPGTLVMNGRTGEGTVGWQGSADRAALAVLLDARVVDLDVGGGTIRVVDRGPERGSRRHVAAVGVPGVTVVEDLDFQRLATPAPGMVFLTDRAFRLTPGFAPFHVGAVREALTSAATPLPLGWDRDFVAAARTRGLRTARPGESLGWLAWNPVVDSLLHDGTLPWYGDIFGETWRTPASLLDRIAARPPARAAAAALDDLRGPGTSEALATLLLQGQPLAAAAARLQVPVALVEGWTRAPVPQDYAVHAGRDGVQVTRETSADAPAEVVRVDVDGAPLAPWIAGPGPASLPIEGRPHHVVVDPEGHLQETDRVDDRWPPHWQTILSGGLYNLSLTEGTFELEGDAALRRQGDSRNLWFGSIWHDEEDIVGLSVGYLRFVGPELNRLVRTHRVSISGGPALLDPAFRPTATGSVAIGGALAYAWDTRQGELSLQGHRYGASLGGGFVPGGDEGWASAGASGIQLVPLHPRAVLALRLAGAWASGDVEHRLLTLGGGDDLRSVAEVAVVGNERVIGNVEARLAVLRYASVPLVGLAWLSEIQLAPGLEAGAVWRDGTRYAALGATCGVHVVFDGFGARPTFFGVNLSTPLRTEGFEAHGPQLFVDFEQAF